MLACASGLPVKHFIAACNANDTIPRFLETAVYEPHTTVPTFSSAMDVADPSNFVRILEIVEHDMPSLRQRLSSVSFSDVQTLNAIKDIYDKYQYTPDPHGAVGYLALEQYLEAHPGSKGYFLETAHSVKFTDAIRQATGKQVALPDVLKPLMERPKERTLLENDYEHLRAILI
jgi:threonine synthase